MKKKKAIEEAVKWLNESTECYAQNVLDEGILLDGFLALSEIMELTTRLVKEL